MYVKLTPVKERVNQKKINASILVCTAFFISFGFAVVFTLHQLHPGEKLYWRAEKHCCAVFWTSKKKKYDDLALGFSANIVGDLSLVPV